MQWHRAALLPRAASVQAVVAAAAAAKDDDGLVGGLAILLARLLAHEFGPHNPPALQQCAFPVGECDHKVPLS